MVGANVFMKGNWVEAGQARNGSFGPSTPPAGYHPLPGPNLAMVYDYGHDGWSAGAPAAFGDYTFPGTPFEGWSIEINGARSDAFFTNSLGTGFWNAAPGTSSLTGGNASGTSSSAVWRGTAGPGGALSITQTTTIGATDDWILVTTVFRNTGFSTLTGLYYERTCDPDNDQTLSGNYTTDNTIVYQNDWANRVMVNSKGTAFGNAYLALGTKDCRAKAMIYSSWPPAQAGGLTLHDMYDQTVPGTYGAYWYAVGTTTHSDIAIGLIYNLGNLAPGQTTSITYAYIFNNDGGIDAIPFPPPPTPAPVAGTIMGPDPICSGNTYSYTNPSGTPGGVWSCSGGATIDPVTGDLTAGPWAGTVTITYTIPANGCHDAVSATKTVTVLQSPVFTLNGPLDVCSGDTYTLTPTFTPPYPGGGSHTYLWSTGATTPSIVETTTVGLGISMVYDLTITNAAGCSTTMSAYVNVFPPPEAGEVYCPGNFCAADEVSYVCGVTGNSIPGTWSLSGGGGDVTIDPTGGWLWVNPATAVPRTVTVYYRVSSPPCPDDVDSCTFTVYPNPQFTITPPFTTCSGIPFTLGAPFTYPYSTVPTTHTYSWSTGATTPTITQTPTVYYGISMVYDVTVTNGFGCSSTQTTYVNIDPEPYAGEVYCPGNFCAADEVSYVCGVTGNNGPGTWSLSGGGGDVTIDPTGGWLWVNPATAVPRTVTVYFTVSNACGTDVDSCTFTVYPNPQFTLTPPFDACSGVPYTLSATLTSPYSTVATTNSYHWSTGATTPSITQTTTVSLGISMVYSVGVTNSFGCTTEKTTYVNVNPTPVAHIEGCPPPLCAGQSFTVWGFPGSGLPSGTWACTPAPGAVISLSSMTGSSVVVTGVTGGTATLSYIVTDPSTTCTGWATCVVTVNPSPSPITGPTSVCVGSNITLMQSVAGGTWTSSNWSVATVAPSGTNAIVTGVSPGVVTIMYRIGSCTASYTVTVVASPTPVIKKCATDMCEGNVQVVLGDPTYFSGYTVTWTCTPPSGVVITLSSPSSSSVTVTGMAAGAAVLTYSVTDPSSGCTGYALCYINVQPPPPPITGPVDICQGQTVTLGGPPPGGTWISSDPTVATVNPMGDVTGVAGGTVTVDYYMPGPGGCYTSTTLNVIPRATACVAWGHDPGCSCNGFIFNGTPGANVNFDVFDCGGSLIFSGSVTLDGGGFASVLTAGLPPDACRLCITSIDFMGCSWPCLCPPGSPGRCCANVGAPKPGAVATTAPPASHLELVPNPNEGRFVLKGWLYTKSSVNLDVVNALGQVVYATTLEVKDYKVDRSFILDERAASGLYFVRVTNDEVHEVLRFIVKK